MIYQKELLYNPADPNKITPIKLNTSLNKEGQRSTTQMTSF